jgi:putative chitinase
MKIDVEKFIFMYVNKFGALNASQHEGMQELLLFLSNDDKIIDVRWTAYILVTVKRECDDKWKPIAEYSRGKGKKYGIKDKITGQIYYGRGYPQTTWKDNYQTSQDIWNKVHPDRKIDLLNNPDLLLNPEIAYFCMSYNMRYGGYTGVGLKKYFNDKTEDPINARRIINGTDVAKLIAGWYWDIKEILKNCVEA